jgi:hypothetical protein
VELVPNDTAAQGREVAGDLQGKGAAIVKTNLTSADPSGWYEFACNSLGRQVAHWDGQYLRGGGYTFYQPNCRNFRRLYYESDIAALREELTALRDEVKRLKSQPYVMRQANEPDCEGLWRNCCGAIREWHETDLAGSNGFHYGPYHYIGPLPVIPVVVEQQPPKVVTIKYQGKNMRAIPSDNPEYWTLLGDNGITCGVAIGKFEEVQS